MRCILHLPVSAFTQTSRPLVFFPLLPPTPTKDALPGPHAEHSVLPLGVCSEGSVQLAYSKGSRCGQHELSSCASGPHGPLTCLWGLSCQLLGFSPA